MLIINILINNILINNNGWDSLDSKLPSVLPKVIYMIFFYQGILKKVKVIWRLTSLEMGSTIVPPILKIALKNYLTSIRLVQKILIFYDKIRNTPYIHWYNLLLYSE